MQGANLPLVALQALGTYTIKPVTHRQCDARPMVNLHSFGVLPSFH